MTTKLLTAFQQWPHGTVATSRWFRQIGIQRDLLFSYKKTGWIRQVGHGAYVRSDDAAVDWTGIIYALQLHYGYNVHPGSRTVLEMRGLAHYVRLGRNTIFLLTPAKATNFLPGWVDSFFNKEVQLKLLQLRIFEDDFTDLVDFKPSHANFSIKISSIEQALLEMLSSTPNHIEFDEAFKVFENTGQLDAQKMGLLLRKCTSIKAKRLFMVLANIINRSWVKDLDTSNVDFGIQQRNLVAGGRYVNKYHINVPKEWFDDGYPQL